MEVDTVSSADFSLSMVSSTMNSMELEKVSVFMLYLASHSQQRKVNDYKFATSIRLELTPSSSNGCRNLMRVMENRYLQNSSYDTVFSITFSEHF